MISYIRHSDSFTLFDIIVHPCMADTKNSRADVSVHLRGCLSEQSVLAASAGTSSGRTVPAWTSKPRSVAFFVFHALTTKDVQSVDEVKHTVAVDGVIFRIAAHRGSDVSAHVALVAQDVEHLE